MIEEIIYPTETHNITCGFHCYTNHNAVDLGAVYELFWPCMDGVIVTLVNSTAGATGRYIEILHDNNTLSRYMHLSTIYVVLGQRVVKKQIVGRTGASGFGSETGYAGAHLHWALHYPTFQSALEVWPYPKLTYGNRYAVDPAFVVENQIYQIPIPKEEDMLVAVNGEGWGFRALAWTPGQGYRFLLQADLLAAEKSGVPITPISIPQSNFAEAIDRVNVLEKALMRTAGLA